MKNGSIGISFPYKKTPPSLVQLHNNLDSHANLGEVLSNVVWFETGHASFSHLIKRQLKQQNSTPCHIYCKIREIERGGEREGGRERGREGGREGGGREREREGGREEGGREGGWEGGRRG